MKKYVMSVHGIRTHGRWQKELADQLSKRSYSVDTFDYNDFSIGRFLLAGERKKKVEQFREWYFDKLRGIDPRRRGVRPSIVAHSFGTYILGECLLKHADVKFDKIILCGSILPPSFAWNEILERNQVWRIRNDYGLKDIWVKLVGWLVPDTGASGARGFEFVSPAVTQAFFKRHEHSDYFSANHINNFWIPFIEEPSLSYEIVNGSRITSPKEFSDTVDRCHEIDIQCYGAIPEYKEVDLPRGLSMTWAEVNPDIYIFLKDRSSGRMLGYLNAMPVTDDAFMQICGGKLKDNQIKSSAVRSYKVRGTIKLYLMSVTIEPGARRMQDGLLQSACERLIYALTQHWENCARLFGCRITEIVAIGWTEEGCGLCNHMGMKQIGTDSLNKPIFSLTLRMVPKKNVFPGFRSLLRAYEELGLDKLAE